MLQYEYTNDVHKVAHVLTEAFTPLIFDLYLSEGDTDKQHHYDFYVESVERYLANGGHVIQAGDFSAVAILSEPGKFINAFRDDVTGNTKKVKDLFDSKAVEYLGDDGKFWHLSYLARDPAHNVKGAVSALVRPFMEKAKEQGVPFMLEAAGHNAMEIYKHWGFKTVEVLKIGEGEVDSQNNPDPNGEGINVYYMIYNYELENSVNASLKL